MKRVILVLTVTLMTLVVMVAGGFPAFAQDEAPDAPQCSWYLNWLLENPREAWWEYWCWWPGWGWEFVFWVWD